MPAKKLAAWAMLGSALLLGGFGCAPEPAPGNESAPIETNNTAEEAPMTATSPNGSITVRNQAQQNGAIYVEKVVSNEDGWLAIHQVVDGKPGYIIGSTAVKKGENANLRVSLRQDRLSETLTAMLHQDIGKIGIFEFSAVDKPVMDGDEPLMQSFTLASFSSPQKASSPSTSNTNTMPAASSPAPSPSPTTNNNTSLAPADAVPVSSLPPEVITVNVTAKQWSFTPSTVTVQKDQIVKLRVTSVDVTHGFSLPAYGVSLTLEPGQTATAEFKAIQQGTFPFSCNVFCGQDHALMKGTLVVK